MRSGDPGAVRLWVYPILLAGIACGFDAANRRVQFGLLSTGALDEVAHLATAALGLLALACFIDVPRRFFVAALVASVAIDLDHIPIYLRLLANPSQRPVAHSLATVAVFAGAAAASRRHRAVLAGAAVGLMLHFGRDIAEGPPGVRILWPLQETAWTASFWWFLGMVIVFTGVRMVLASTGIPQARVRLFTTPAPSRSPQQASIHCVNSGDRSSCPGPQEPDAEGGNRARLSCCSPFCGMRMRGHAGARHGRPVTRAGRRRSPSARPRLPRRKRPGPPGRTGPSRDRRPGRRRSGAPPSDREAPR
jgi:inner membrane protein